MFLVFSLFVEFFPDISLCNNFYLQISSFFKGVSIYIGPRWLPYYFCSLTICIYTRCLNIHGTHMAANNSTNNSVFFFSDLKIEYEDNY